MRYLLIIFILFTICYCTNQRSSEEFIIERCLYRYGVIEGMCDTLAYSKEELHHKILFNYTNESKGYKECYVVSMKDHNFYAIINNDTFRLELNHQFNYPEREKLKHYWLHVTEEEYRGIYIDIELGVLLIQANENTYIYKHRDEKQNKIDTILNNIKSFNVEKNPPLAD